MFIHFALDRGACFLYDKQTRSSVEEEKRFYTMPSLSNRVQTFTDSVIRRMTRISDEHGAINLSQGFPDFNP